LSNRDHGGAQRAARIEADTDFSRVWPTMSALPANRSRRIQSRLE